MVHSRDGSVLGWLYILKMNTSVRNDKKQPRKLSMSRGPKQDRVLYMAHLAAPLASKMTSRGA